MPDNKNIDYTNNNEIKIFLASSINEFEKERNKIGDLVRRMQDELLEKGIRINLFECQKKLSILKDLYSLKTAK